MHKKTENIKCVVVGDDGVGKSSLILSYTYHCFPDYISPVFEEVVAEVVVDGAPCRLCQWDTAGHDDYNRLRPLSYHGTDVFLVCFSLMGPSSFESIRSKWYPEIEHHSPGVPHLLVGTKLDVRDNKKLVENLRQKNLSPIQTSDGEALKNELNSFKYMECSALTQQGMKEVFLEAARCVIASRARAKATKTKCVVL